MKLSEREKQEQTAILLCNWALRNLCGKSDGLSLEKKLQDTVVKDSNQVRWQVLWKVLLQTASCHLFSVPAYLYPMRWYDPSFNLGLDDICATFQERHCFSPLPLFFILRKGLNTPSDQSYRHAKVKPLHAAGQTKNENTCSKQKQMVSVAGN